MAPYLEVRPGFDAGLFWTEETAAIDLVMEQLYDVNKIATPTLILLLNNAREVEFGPDETIGYKLLTDMYNVHVMHDNQVFNAGDLDPVTKMQYSPAKWYSAASTSRAEMVEYGRRNRSRVDLVDEKVQAMHRGLTWVQAFRLFSNWNEPIVGGFLNIETALAASPLPPTLEEEGLAGGQAERPFSIPMAIRSDEFHHTFGNLSSENPFWQSTESIGGAVTRAGAGLVNTDVVISIDATVELGISEIRSHLASIQYGGGYRFYAACPADLYTVIEEYVMADRRVGGQQPAEELNDLGIDAAFTYAAYNTTFYVDPMMTWLWPNSIFFWDPDCLFMIFDPAFNPWVADWERIPNSSTFATSVVYHGQLVATDRRGLSAMHAYDAGV